MQFPVGIMIYNYIVESHPEFGTQGMRPLFLPGTDPAMPLQATHDLLEHFIEPVNSHTELQALGAMLYIRGNGGYFKNFSIERALAADLHFVTTHQSVYGKISNPGVTRPLEDYVESWITKAMPPLYKELKDNDDSIELDKNYPHWLRGWIRIGYRRANKRYTLDPFIVSCQFEQIERDLDEKFKKGWLENGDLIRINLVRSTMNYTITVINWYDPEHPNYIDLGEE